MKSQEVVEQKFSIHFWAAALMASAAYAAPAMSEEPAAAEAAPLEVADAAAIVADAGEVAQIETITVVGTGSTRASNTLSQQQIESQAAGVAPQALLNSLPGVNVQLTDPFGLYEFGTSVRVRGFTSEQLAVTLDGVPLEETPDTRDSTPPNRYVDSENLSEISVAQGSGDVTAPSFHALGGSLRYLTTDPVGNWRALFSGTAGDDDMNRVFLRVDTPELWKGGPTAYLSGSRTGAVQWQNPMASMRTEHLQFKARQVLDIGTLTLMYMYGNRDDHDISSYLRDGSPSFGLTRNITGDPSVDALFYDNWLNGRTDELWSLRGEFNLSDTLKLAVQPYYEHKKGYGTAGVPPSAAQDLYDNTVDPETGSPGRTDVAPPTEGRFTKRLESMGGDRYGVTAGLTWTVGINEFQFGGWYQDYDFFQVRPLYNLDSQGNFDTSSLPVTVYYDRDINTKVTQFYLKDKLTLTDRLIVELGSKGLIVDREAQGYLNTTDFNALRYVQRQKKDTDYFQPQVGFVFNLTDTVETFANYAENFSAIPRLAFMASSFNPDLQPETSTNIDLGIRTSGRRFGGSFTLYHIDYKDRVLALTSADPFRVGEDTYENVGDIETYGAELAAFWNPSKAWRLGSSVSLNSSKFQDDYETAFVNDEGEIETRIVPVKGNYVTDTPTTMISADASYHWSYFTIGGDAKYTGKRYSATTGTESVDPYTLLNFNLGFKGEEGVLPGVSIKAILYNALDEDYLGVISPGETTGEFNLGAPRTFYITVSAEI